MIALENPEHHMHWSEKSEFVSLKKIVQGLPHSIKQPPVQKSEGRGQPRPLESPAAQRGNGWPNAVRVPTVPPLFAAQRKSSAAQRKSTAAPRGDGEASGASIRTVPYPSDFS